MLRRWTLALVAWTVLVWGTRIDNVLADDGLSGGAKAARLALSGALLALAGLAAVEWWAARRRPTPRRRWATHLAPLAGVTIVVWLVRGTGIALADHDGAFIAVHLALAVVSIALSAAVLAARPTGREALSPDDRAAVA